MSIQGPGNIHDSLKFLAKFEETYKESSAEQLLREFVGIEHQGESLDKELKRHVTVITDAITKGDPWDLSPKEVADAAKTMAKMIKTAPADEIKEQLKEASKALTEAKKIFAEQSGSNELKAPSFFRRFSLGKKDSQAAIVENIIMYLEANKSAMTPAEKEDLRRALTQDVDLREHFNSLIKSTDETRGNALWKAMSHLTKTQGTSTEGFERNWNFLKALVPSGKSQGVETLRKLHGLLGEDRDIDATAINQLFRTITEKPVLRKAFNPFTEAAEKRWPVNPPGPINESVNVDESLNQITEKLDSMNLDPDALPAIKSVLVQLNQQVIPGKNKAQPEALKSFELIEQNLGPNLKLDDRMASILFKELAASEELRQSFDEVCQKVPVARRENLRLLESGIGSLSLDSKENSELLAAYNGVLHILSQRFEDASNAVCKEIKGVLTDVVERALPINLQVHTDALPVGLFDYTINFNEIDDNHPDVFLETYKKRPGVTEKMIRSAAYQYVYPYCNLQKIIKSADLKEGMMPGALYRPRNTANLQQAVSWEIVDYFDSGGLKEATRIVSFRTQNGKESSAEVKLNLEPFGEHTAEQGKALIDLMETIDEKSVSLGVLYDEVHRRIERGEEKLTDYKSYIGENFPEDKRDKALKALKDIDDAFKELDWLDDDKKKIAFELLIDFTWKMGNGISLAMLGLSKE